MGWCIGLCRSFNPIRIRDIDQIAPRLQIGLSIKFLLSARASSRAVSRGHASYTRARKYASGDGVASRGMDVASSLSNATRRIEIRVNQSVAKFEPLVYYTGKTLLLPFPEEFDLSHSATHYYRTLLAVPQGRVARAHVRAANFFN